MQAQDYAGAKWAIAQRTAGATNDAIERLIARGAILRTHVLRPTWHFVLPSDIRWMLRLTGPRVAALLAHNDRRLGITPSVLRRGIDAMAEALTGGRQLTRTELAAVLARAGIDASDGLRVGHVIMHAELDAVLCSGARRGKQFTYALLDERAPATPAIDRDEALGQLATRYFATRAPATIADFAWWSGLTVRDAKRGAEAAGVARRRSAAAPTTSAHLLPNYDELFIGYRDRSAFLERVNGIALMQRNTPLALNVVEIDGQIVGGWRRGARGTAVETTLLVSLTHPQRRALDDQIARYAAFLTAGAGD